MAVRFAGKKATQRTKTVMLVGALILVLIPFFMWILNLQQNTSTPKQQEAQESGIVDKPQPTGVSVIQQGYTTYEYDKYTINYPADWKVEELTSDVDTGVILKPPYLTDDVYVPSLSITVSENLFHPYLTERQSFFTSFGFTSSAVNLDGYSAARLRGTFPPRASESNQEVRIFLDKDEYSYLLVYKYTGLEVNEDFERLFEGMISTFKFH